MNVAVSKERGLPAAVTSREIATRARRMLRALDEDAAELSVSLVGDATIHELNRDFRHKNKATDVLSFAMLEGETGHFAHAAHVLGDVVISLETAARQASKRRKTLLDETTMLLAHGLLHLLGWDHRTDLEDREMRAATRQLVRASTAQSQPNSAVAKVRRRTPGAAASRS